jgi:hypothetical protein
MLLGGGRLETHVNPVPRGPLNRTEDRPGQQLWLATGPRVRFEAG